MKPDPEKPKTDPAWMADEMMRGKKSTYQNKWNNTTGAGFCRIVKTQTDAILMKSKMTSSYKLHFEHLQKYVLWTLSGFYDLKKVFLMLTCIITCIKNILL